MSNKTGITIALDGPDGVGKTTQLNLLSDFLENSGRKIHKTRSSGGTPIGEKLREVSLSTVERPPQVDLYISMAMSVGVGLDIQKHKARGEVILADRSPLAIIAYQVFGSQLPDKKEGYDACQKMLDLWNIDMLIFFEASQSVLDKRRNHRIGHDKSFSQDYFEKKGIDYHRRVDEGYTAAIAFAEKMGVRLVRIDASGSIEQIAEMVKINIQKL